VIELADGLWRWTARHPDWHPSGEFGAEVGSYAAHEGGRTVLIDPLLSEEAIAALDEIVTGELPGLRALAFGDRIVGVEGGLRYWSSNKITEARSAFFHRQTAPQLRHLLDVDFDRALVTHGEPVLRDGRQALEDALAAEPWYHRPS
jgi:hypothetical protein